MPKNMKTMDGNCAAAHVSYAFTEVAGIYPITPSSTMAEYVDEWSAGGMKNIFGQTVKVLEMQSEAGAAGTVHGSLAAGALTTTYTASQGLLLMIPNMYKLAGELLPAVLHVSARAIAGHALSIFGDHSDVMACRQTGFAMLASSSVQEVMDLGAVAHLTAIKSRVPFLHFFDGFRTSHEIQKIETLEFDDLAKLVDWDAIKAFRERALNPEHPVTRGTAQNPDIFFQAKEAANPYYDGLAEIVLDSMKKLGELTGRTYKLFDYYGAADAEQVIIAMGSACDAIKETIDYLNNNGRKTGLVNVHLYRPFSAKHFLEAIPATAKKIAVMDRCKEPGSQGEPLYQDVCTAFFEAGRQAAIVGGRYGLGSKDVTPASIIAVYDNLAKEQPANHFTVGITDDVTKLSLALPKEIDVTPEGTVSCKFWGLGSDGTVGANKNSIKIIGDYTDMYAQAYFAYDSKKSGGVTTSHLRFGTKPIRSSYLVKTADFVACHNPSYLGKYDMTSDIKDGGTFLLNCIWDAKDVENYLPAAVKRDIANRGIKFYIIDGIGIAREIGLGNRINTVLQSAFFKIANIIPFADAVKHMKEAIDHSFGKKGGKVLEMNYAAVDRGGADYTEIAVPEAWKTAQDEETAARRAVPAFIENVVFPMNAQNGDSLPVSTFVGREDGTFPMGTAAYEKRSVAVDVPRWIPENCIQCNQCSYVCPHATIRPFLLTADEKAASGMDTLKATGKGFEDYQFRMQVDPEDCYGCGVCANVCPSKNKALVMEPIASQEKEIANWYYCVDKIGYKDNPGSKESVKGSQFEQPLLEFSGACAGCGETPYAKLVTQLFGDRMYISNATGCSSIWGASAPTTPYTTNKEGKGPCWANSLFEDNAEHGYGMAMAVKQRRDLTAEKARELAGFDWCYEPLKTALNNWLEAMDDGEASKKSAAALEAALIEGTAFTAEDGAMFTGEYEKFWDAENTRCTCPACTLAREILAMKDMFVKKSVWIFGGDGWAYDIGYGGLDHVLASGENVNVLVFDTEVYSNTGGQASKSTPTAATAKFAASGKKIRKKDLGMMAMSYGYVYVAQVAMGADQNHLIKCLIEAEKYDGPSLIIAYAPCINQGIRAGMAMANQQVKKAVEAGYWHLYSYNPDTEEGKNPFKLASKEPSGDFDAFIRSESRYTALEVQFPEIAAELFAKAKEDAAVRYQSYKKKAE